MPKPNTVHIICLFGYMGYEMIQYFENVVLSKENNLKLPDSIFIRPSMTLVFDNVNDKLFITRSVSQRQKAQRIYSIKLKKIFSI